MGHLDTRGEARRQVGFADRLFISKADLVGEADLALQLCQHGGKDRRLGSAKRSGQMDR
jgi:G3E family GTPase